MVTIDNRGIAPSDPCPDGFTVTDMAGDVAGLIDHLGLGSCRLVGFSLGAIAVQELLVERPELVRAAVLMATVGRADTLTRAYAAAEMELADSGVKVPPAYLAITSALHHLSRRTLNDETQLSDWLDVFEMSAVDLSSIRSQLGMQVIPDRRRRYRAISCPCLVIGFSDDLTTRPHLCREVADAIPGAVYREIEDCGHFGYLERPAEVNAAILEFFAGR